VQAEKKDVEPVRDQVQVLVGAVPSLEKRHEDLERRHNMLDEATKPSPSVSVTPFGRTYRSFVAHNGFAGMKVLFYSLSPESQ